MAEEEPPPPLNPKPEQDSSRDPEPGVAQIKQEYVIPHDHTPVSNDDRSDQPPPSKKRRRGQNKHRPRAAKISFSEMLCPSLHANANPDHTSCAFGEKCRYMHDVAQYMSTKLPDIGNQCYMFDRFGMCQYGAACRFASAHMTPEYINMVKEGVYNPLDALGCTCNSLSKELQEALRKRKVVFERSETYLKSRQSIGNGVGGGGGGGGEGNGGGGGGCSGCATPVPPSGVVTDEGATPVPPSGMVTDEGATPVPPSGMVTDEGATPVPPSGVVTDEGDTPVPPSGMVTDEGATPVPPSGVVTDEGLVSLKPDEKKKIDFRGKLFLAPLTTTGNLPFRRICKEFGADITCGEMAMCTNLLQGQQSEWALLRRHESEDVFGVQVCGSHMDTMTKCAELINNHTSVDFVDINTGCPIDLVFKKGAGSALMGRHTRFESIVRGMREVLDCPLTVKMRTGIYKKNWNAHKLIPKLRDWGVSMVTVHGRSRQQRYTKLADWDYIRTCVEVADPMPVFGNGDILSFEDYNAFYESSHVAGTMLARGALIKPWVFTEIKELRHWDIRSSERLDILRRYANYGLEHWGSDTLGVENTRKFLLEWLSFLYRYIPVGILERVPQKINQRPPYYQGRDELETLMASNNCQDWVKISKMLLGPAPDQFSFLPKHRANAYN